MPAHPIMPGVELGQGFLDPSYEPFLREWRENAIALADAGDTAASVCHQGALIDLVLDGHIRHDWRSVMKDLLTIGAAPSAYSKEFGQRLHKFDGQVAQSTVHSIYTRWWIALDPI